MSRNILSISQLCAHNNILIEFSSFSFILKDRLTGASLLNGHTTNGVYELSSSPTVLVATTDNSAHTWHHKLAIPLLQFSRH